VLLLTKSYFLNPLKDKRTRAMDKETVAVLEKEYNKKAAELKSVLVNKLFTILSGKTSQGILSNLGDDLFLKGVKIYSKGSSRL
jgi:DNA-directed RNA polymerase subunit beta